MIRNQGGPFAIVPLWVLEGLIEHGKPEALRLYVALSKWTSGHNRACHPSRRTMADYCGVSDRTVDGYVKALKAIGALRVQHRKADDGDNETNLYTVMIVPPGETDVAPPGEADFAQNQTHLNQTLIPTESSSGSRRRNPTFDALVVACGYEYADMTKRARQACGVAAAELDAVGATPDEILRRAQHYRTHFPQTTITPSALASQWATIARPLQPGRKLNKSTAAVVSVAQRLAMEEAEQTPTRDGVIDV